MSNNLGDDSQEVHLFTPLTIRGVTFPNRIFLSPMCMYSSEDGFANDWHFVHIGSRAVGGAGLLVMEATAVDPIGRITPKCLGLWKDEHIPGLKRITDFVHSQNGLVGIQIGHAGRKASMNPPPERIQVSNEDGGWDVVGPSAIPYNGMKTPTEMTIDQIKQAVKAFGETAKRAVQAGFDVIEIHGAHGYLITSFYSPESNKRTDEYGGSFENRTRLIREIVQEVRSVIPDTMPLFVRLTSSDYIEPEGWKIEDTVELSKILKDLGTDLVDCSGGGNAPNQKVSGWPSYQVDFATHVRETGVLSGAVGMITDPQQADDIIKSKKADVVFIGRQFLLDPYFPITAARKLGYNPPYPRPYAWPFPKSKN